MPVIADRRGAEFWVWDVNLLDWYRGAQPTLEADNVTVEGTITVQDGGGSLTVDGPLTDAQLRATALPVSGTFFQVTQPVSVASMSPLIASGQVNGGGNNTLLTPTAGKKLRIHYFSYNPLLAVEAAFRFGASGTLFLRNNVTANSIVAKEFGTNRGWEGAVDEALILNLSLGVSVNWNVVYSEV